MFKNYQEKQSSCQSGKSGLRRAAPVELTADQIVYLTNAGVSQNIVKALIDGGTQLPPDSDKDARPNKTVIAVGVSPHTDSPAPIPVLKATTGSTSNDPYEELGPTMSGIWTADLDPGYDGAPRQIEITHRRDSDTGGIAIGSRIVTKGKSTPEASGLIQWDPQEQTFHLKTVRATGEVTTGVVHPEANVVISEGTMTFTDGAKLDSKSIASISSPNVGKVEVFLKYKGCLLYTSGSSVPGPAGNDSKFTYWPTSPMEMPTYTSASALVVLPAESVTMTL